MHFFLLISNAIPLTLSTFGMYEDVDVIFLIFHTYLKYERTHCRRLPILLLRFLWAIITMTEAWKQIGFWSLSCLLALQIVSKALVAKTQPVRRFFHRRNLWGKAKYRLQVQWSFGQAYKIYKRLYLIIFAGINPTMNFFIPYFMAMGLVLCILCDFTTISLHSQMESALLVVMPSVSFCMKFIILTMLPQACAVNEEAVGFIRGWQTVASLGNRISRRKLKALLPLRIFAGSFFYFKRSTKTTYFSVIMYYTVTAVISIGHRRHD